MPLTINVGLSKKVGMPDYGSVGATCNLQFEADHDLLDDLESFHAKVAHAYVAARQAVLEQLAREQQANGAAPVNGHTATNGHGAAGASNNGVSNGYVNGSAATGNGSRNGQGNAQNTGHPASEKQIGYAKQLAKSISGLGIRRLENLSSTMFGKPLAALTSMDASGLIDTLKQVKDGSIDLDGVLGGNAA